MLAVPNELGSSKAMVDKFSAAIKEKGVMSGAYTILAAACTPYCVSPTLPPMSSASALHKPAAEVSAWDVPWMKVGTLDALLALGDELARADSYAEGVVRKVERQVVDSYAAARLAESTKNAKAPAGDERAFPPLELRVRGLAVAEYVRRFTWDVEQYDPKVRLTARLSGGPRLAFPIQRGMHHRQRLPAARLCRSRSLTCFVG